MNIIDNELYINYNLIIKIIMSSIIEYKNFNEIYSNGSNSNLERSRGIISNAISQIESNENSIIEAQSSNIQLTGQLRINLSKDEIYMLHSTISEYAGGRDFKNFCIEAGMILSKSF